MEHLGQYAITGCRGRASRRQQPAGISAPRPTPQKQRRTKTMKQQSPMKEECPHNLNTKAEICPLSIATHLPPEASLDDLRELFTDFVERDLWELTNVSVGEIVTLFENPSLDLLGTFDEKCNAVTQLFVRGLFAKRAEMLKANRQKGRTA